LDLFRSVRRITPATFLAAALTSACSGSPSGPTPPPPVDGPKISCPSNQTVRTTAASVRVSYPLATTSGGTAPVSVSCTPPSESLFPGGTSSATCVATDARQQTASCSFSVIVEVVPLLAATRFLAFGDSITEGILASADLTPIPYPAGLGNRLTARYTMQQFSIVNAGRGGEQTVDGVNRFPGALASANPEVVLLFEGVNDLAGGESSKISVVVNNLRTMIQTARGRGAQVFLATLLPEIPGGRRTGAIALIVPANDQIRALAAGQGVPLVDLYQAFNGMERVLIGDDGLHPNPAGYEKIADVFFEAVRSRLELPPGVSTLTSNAAATPVRTY
jgi:lysophospholipase L1-like esterase